MPQIFCPVCAYPTKYSYQKPEECSCGHSFAAVIKPAKRKYEREEEEESDLEDEDYDPPVRKKDFKLKRLNIDLGMSAPRFEKLGEIVGTAQDEPRLKRKGISKEDYRQKVFKPIPLSIEGE